jgi:prevent-host-death family protein
MKVIEQAQATRTLADYAAEIEEAPVIVTSQGQPVAALVPIDNDDLETVTPSTNRQFFELIERSRAQTSADGGISSNEMRRRLTKRKKTA